MHARRVLRYVESTTHTGRVLVVMSGAGVVDIILAEGGIRRREVLKRAQARFPDAVLTPDDGTHGSWAAAAVARIDGAAGDVRAPVDLGGQCGAREGRLGDKAMRMV